MWDEVRFDSRAGQFVRVEGHLIPSQGERDNSTYYRIEAFKLLE